MDNPEDLVETRLPSELSDDDLYTLLKSWYITDMKANSPWYAEAKTDYGFESGDQITAEERSQYEADQRINVSMNRVKPTVDVICGMEVTNRLEVQYIPRTTASALPVVDPQTMQPIPPNPNDDDAELNEGYTEVARWARDNCDAEDEESDMFRDVVICGMGWTSTEMDYESDPEGKIVIDRLDPLEMGWDSTATKRNLDDAKRYSRTKRDISAYDAHASFPGKDLTDLHAGWAFEARLGEGYDHDRELARSYENKNINSEQRKSITMVIMQWCEVETQYEVINPADGKPLVLDAKRFKEAKKAAGDQPLTSREVRKKVWKQATLGAKLLKVEDAPCKDHASFRCTTGYRDRNKRQWYGIVRPMRDPQKWANKFFSVALEQIATSGKGLLAEIGAFVDDKKAEREWAKTGNIAWLKPGGMQKVGPKPQPPMLTGLADLMTLSLQGIRDVTGVNQETIGMADRDQAAALEYQRRQAGVTILAAFFDNLRRYRKEQGRVLLYFIQNYISDGRLVRIVGENGPKFVQLIKQSDSDYDTIVDQAASSPNQKEATWTVMQPLLPIMMDKGAPPAVMLEVLKASPLPESSVQRIKRAYEKSQQEQAQKGPSLQEQQLQADIQKTQAEAQAKQIDAQTKGQELQSTQFQAQLDMQMKAQELEAKKMELAGQEQQRQMDMLKFQAEMQAQAEQRQHDMTMRLLDYKLQEMKLQEGQQKAQNESMAKEQDRQIQAESGKGIEGMAKAMTESVKINSEALKESLDGLAKALIAPKTAKLSADGLTATVQ